MADYPCDGDCGGVATLSITNFATSEVQFYEGRCLGILGAAMLREIDPDLLADMAKPAEPEPKPEPPKRGRGKAEPEHDPHRVIAEIVEDQPRPPDELPKPEGEPAVD